MRFEVPQFIEIEDKIIGPFTWKQFVYLAGGIGLCIIFFLSTPFVVAVLLSIPIGALSGALTFHRVNNRPFSVFLESVVNYFSHSRLYLWRREEVQSVIDKGSVTDTTKVPDSTHATSMSTPPPQGAIHTLSRKLELPLSQ